MHGRAPAPAALLRSLTSILDSTSLCALATVAPGPRAHGSHVCFARSAELEVYFLSDPRSNHARRLEENPSMAVSVFDSHQRWGGPDRGAALDGTCRALAGRAAARAEAIYGRRFAAYPRWKAATSPGEAALRWRFFGFRPSRAKVFDEPAFGEGVFVTARVRPARAKRSEGSAGRRQNRPAA
jgi:hypothetical protein